MNTLAIQMAVMLGVLPADPTPAQIAATMADPNNIELLRRCGVSVSLSPPQPPPPKPSPPAKQTAAGQSLALADCSIITTCKGRLHHLRRSLPAMLAQGAGEVLLVDYADPDHSGAWAEMEFGERVKVVRPRPINPPYFNPAHARNCAAREARGKLLVFIDADVIPSRDWLADALARLNAAPQSPFVRCVPHSRNWSKTGTCAIRREVFFQVRGYREAIDRWGYEDIDLYGRLSKIGPPIHHDAEGKLELIQHGDGLRTRHFPERDRERGHAHVRAKLKEWTGMVNPEGFGRADPFARGVVTAANAEFFPGLQTLAESIRQTEPWPMRCVDLGLTDAQRQWCDRNQVSLIPLAEVIDAELLDSFGEGKLLWARPWLISAGPFRDVAWIDADAVATAPLGGLFDLIDRGAAIFADDFNPTAAPNDPELYDLLSVPRVTARHVNSGVLGLRMDRDDDLIAAWKFCIAEATERPEVRKAIGWHDQGALLWALHRTGRTHLIRPAATWNRPADGLSSGRVAERRRFAAGAGLPAEVRRVNPGAGVVHYMYRPKLWELTT